MRERIATSSGARAPPLRAFTRRPGNCNPLNDERLVPHRLHWFQTVQTFPHSAHTAPSSAELHCSNSLVSSIIPHASMRAITAAPSGRVSVASEILCPKKATMRQKPIE